MRTICIVLLLAISQADLFGQDSRWLDLSLLASPPEYLQPRLGRIANIFVDRCVSCHDAADAQGGYSMASPAKIFAAGESKLPAIGAVTTDHAGRITAFPQGLGQLWDRITSTDPALRMPKDSDPLDPDQIEEIRNWIAMGAKVDGSMDAPIESFLPVYIPTEPKLESYPRPHTVQAISIDSSSKMLFTSGYQEVLVWRWMEEPDPHGKIELVARLSTRGRWISDMQWDSVQELLWIASGDPGRIGYVEAVPFKDSKPESNPKVRRVAWVSRDTPLDISVSPNGELVGIGNADGTVVVIDALTNGIRWRMSAHAAAVTSLDWTRDSKTLLSSSRDRMAKSFEAQDGTMLSSFVDNERTVASIVALTRGLIAFDEAGAVRFYPNPTTPNSRTKRGGFLQQTNKLVASNDDFFVMQSDQIKHFRVRREEVEVPDESDKDKADEKKEEKKKKKKTEFHIDERPGIRLVDPRDSNRRLTPLSMQVSRLQTEDPGELMIAIGCAEGDMILWVPDSKTYIMGSNRP